MSQPPSFFTEITEGKPEGTEQDGFLCVLGLFPLCILWQNSVWLVSASGDESKGARYTIPASRKLK